MQASVSQEFTEVNKMKAPSGQMLRSLYKPGYAGLPKPSPNSYLIPPPTPTVDMTMNDMNPGYGYTKFYAPVNNDNYQVFIPYKNLAN